MQPESSYNSLVSDKELIRLFEKHGFGMAFGSSGSHYVLKKAEDSVTIPRHGKKDIGKGLLNRILKDGGLKWPANILLKIGYNEKYGVYEVSCAGLRGCLTFGETLAEAKELAREALTVYLDCALEHNQFAKIRPFQHKNTGKYTCIEPEFTTCLAIWLRHGKRKERPHPGRTWARA